MLAFMALSFLPLGPAPIGWMVWALFEGLNPTLCHKARISPPALTPLALTPLHRVEELGVALGRLDFVQEELHRLEVIHRVQQLAQHPDLGEDVLRQQQLLAAGAG